MTKYKFEANERKQQRIIDSRNICEVCGKGFPSSSLQLSHIIEASKANIKLFGKEVMYHDDIMKLACDKHNSSVLKSRKTHPVEAFELLLTIMFKLHHNGSDMTEAFNNLGACLSEVVSYKNMYKYLQDRLNK